MNDGGTGRFMDTLGSDEFIKVLVNRTAANKIEGGCTSQCFPRVMSLDIAYYQLDGNEKKIVDATLSFESFDKDTATHGYTLKFSYSPLHYWGLIKKFAFERRIFQLLFVAIGCIAVGVAAAFWLVVRLTTQLANPPRMRFWSMYSLIAPPAFSGTLLGLVPIVILTFALTTLINGPKFFGFYEQNTWIVDGRWKLHYMDADIDPANLLRARYGRMGVGFIVISAMCLYQGAKIFLPDRATKREKELEKKRDPRAEKESVWTPIVWRRSNMVFTCYMMGMFSLFFVEFSFWSNFGTYYWYVFIAYTILDMFIGNVVDFQLKEVLLTAPVGTGFGIVTGITTLGASDFLDFLLGYFLDLVLLMLFRVYIDPTLGDFLDWVADTYAKTIHVAKQKLPKWLATRLGIEQDPPEGEGGAKAEEEEAGGEGGETVEPILDSFGSYSTDTLSLFYFPYCIFLLMWFRYETGLPELYGIKEQDMEYYLWFSLIIIPFQVMADIFIHGVLELFHGWKIYDYLVYTRYRFLQRETRWKGLEDSLDECIDESMRTLDQMCFSSQYYMMMTIAVNGIVYFVLGVQMMTRNNYNMWGDPALIYIVIFVVTLAHFVGKVLLFLAIKFNLWKIKHENTAWHSNVEDDDDFEIPDMEDLQGASHDAYLMNQRITSETFRYKFLNYNRSWLINQLPSVLTQRTLRRSRPYLINQFTRILNQLNQDISSDSEEEGPDFGPVALTAKSRNIIRMWLSKAKKQLRLREAVQPLINKARGANCEQCLSKKQLQVRVVIPLEELALQFEQDHPENEFNKVQWKKFWMQHQRYETLCLPCISRSKEDERQAAMKGAMSESDDDQPETLLSQLYPDWGPVYLAAASQAILLQWYRQAQERVFGQSGRKRKQVILDDVSDDSGDEDANLFGSTEDFSEASKAIAIKWLRTARARLQSRMGTVRSTGKPAEKQRTQRFQRK
ncbi:unnamed protein product [Chrysoparadoxa australica]